MESLHDEEGIVIFHWGEKTNKTKRDETVPDFNKTLASGRFTPIEGFDRATQFVGWTRHVRGHFHVKLRPIYHRGERPC